MPNGFYRNNHHDNEIGTANVLQKDNLKSADQLSFLTTPLPPLLRVTPCPARCRM